MCECMHVCILVFRVCGSMRLRSNVFMCMRVPGAATYDQCTREYAYVCIVCALCVYMIDRT